MALVAAAVTGVAVGATALLSWRCSKAKALPGVPARCRRVVLVEANSDLSKARLEVQDMETPRPRKGQVLVRVAAAPVNPSDDGIWKVTPRNGYPLPLGNEGSGTVVATGGGLFAGRLLGRNVAVAGGGTYAEYTCVDAKTAFSLPDDLPVEDACAFFVNPFTVVGIVETVKQLKGRAFIHTAAASQLGQMMVKYCKAEGVTLVNLVRRKEQAELLRSLGAEHVVSTEDGDWQMQMEALIKTLRIKLAFDAIAGTMSGTLLGMLPPGGTVFVYGRLSNQAVGNVQPLDLIYRGKKLEGWLLTKWLMQGGLLKSLLRSIKTGKLVTKHLRGVFASEFKDTTLAGMHSEYCSSLSSGLTGMKMRVRPQA